MCACVYVWHTNRFNETPFHKGDPFVFPFACYGRQQQRDNCIHRAIVYDAIYTRDFCSTIVQSNYLEIVCSTIVQFSYLEIVGTTELRKNEEREDR